ncbi:glycosyltransferase family 2 protein [Lutimonas zeaxanthinifaciens]|uniref:glycosyltransferase family 2 protein n=1 Tax=Lutimonas zeaxanthinifaciens TaxID=3060215 RepID=UPI00265D43FF|nr:glycosyltransferase family 2 protein [Lutimonas sp. YSD2104]WKK64652.1 glycosyltransferase family 2 protein [Lutimonas sp. YSD2104]
MISIIIVNYRGWSALKKCLLSLDQIEDQIGFEVIVVDNYSNDGEFLNFKNEFPSFQFILNEGNFGFANGCNLGAKVSIGNYLLFLNPDTIIKNDTLQSLKEIYQSHPEIALLSCVQQDENGRTERQERLFPSFFRFFGVFRSFDRILNRRKYRERFKDTDSDLIFPDWISGSVVFTDSSWFDKVSGWNEDFWLYLEDVDFCKRISEQGGKMAISRKTSILHMHGGTSRINLKTKALTKTEVIISKHVYISLHFNPLEAFLLHFLMITGFLIERIFLSIVGILFFFKPKLRVNIFILKNLLVYYANALRHLTWISPRSVNFRK